MSASCKGLSVWVVDCSAFMPMVLADERASGIERLLEQTVEGEVHVVVPPLFWYETGNVLRMAVVRNRISAGDAKGALARVTELPLETDGDLSPAVVLRMSRLAAQHGLTMYDAAYFELAERHGANLLTGDADLLKLGPACPWIRSTAPEQYPG